MRKTLFLLYKRVKVFSKKILSLGLAATFFLEITTPALATYLDQIKEDPLISDLQQTLQNEYLNHESNLTEKSLALCLEKNNLYECSNYVDKINSLFTETRNQIESNNTPPKEQDISPSPLSQKEYNKQLAKSNKEEYNKHLSAIEQSFKTKTQIIDFKYKNATLNTPEYSEYIFAKTNLLNWKNESLKNLAEWEARVWENREQYYQLYLEEFALKLQEYNLEKEAVFNAYLRELANNLMQIYDKASDNLRVKMTDIFVMLLSMETDKVKLFTSQQRSTLFRFFKNLLVPQGSNSTNPCRFNTRPRTNAEMGEYNAYQQHLNNIENQTQGTISASDRVARQTQGYRQNLANSLRAPITELADEQACQLAFSALNGLAFYKGGWDMSAVANFMLKNTTEPLAAEVLLMGAKTLIESGRLEYFYSLHLDLIREENKFAKTEDLTLREKMFFENRFYRGPYLFSRYSEADGQGDAWQDIAKMLSNEKNTTSAHIQHSILDHSVAFNNGEISFNHNLPFIYGILLNNPSVIDSFVPKTATADNSDDLSSYSYKGQKVFFQYFDDHTEAYIKDEQTGAFYLPPNAVIQYVDETGYATIKAGKLCAEKFEIYRENKQQKTEKYKTYFKYKNLKPSAVYAEAFYKADFVDLTLKEKLAMDKALEQKYPHLKKFSARHKEKLKNNRRNADITSGVITIIDVGLTLWCVADIYKVAKWGIKSVKALRTLITAGKTTSALSAARKMAFFRQAINGNEKILSVHKKLKKIANVDKRIVNKFPAYSQGVDLMRVSADGKRYLQVVKLGAKPIKVGQNTIKGQVIESNFAKFMATTSDYVAVPAGMPGQRLAVSNFNRYIAAGGNNNLFEVASRLSKQAKQLGPIRIFNKNGQDPIYYNQIKFNKEGYLEVGDDFFKTFKATMKPEDIDKYKELLEGTIADLEKTLEQNKERIAFLKKEFKKADALSAAELAEYEKFEDMQKLVKELKNKRYLLLRPQNLKRNIIEKWRSHKSSYEIVPLYDEEGNVIYQLSLDLSLNKSRQVSKALKNGDKLVLKGGSLYLGGKLLEANFGISKEVITLLAKAGKDVEDFYFLTLTKTSSKMFPFVFNNALGFSTASTSLNMSLNQSPFNNPDDPNYIPQPIILGISVGFPYAFSLLSPMAAPFVKRFGAVNVQVGALLIACAGMSYATFNGYYGFATKKKDENGKVIRDENGKTIHTDKAPSYWPLVVASFSAGISSALKKASLNTAIHTYQTSKATMATSMLAKNFGALFMTFIPWAMESRFFFGKDNIDFSISYPFLAGLSLLSITFMKSFLPSSIAKEAGYKMMPSKTTFLPKLRDFGDAGKEIFKPFKLAASSRVMPYFLSYTAFGATEAFVLFKTFNTFARDAVYNTLSDTDCSKNDKKLIASVLLALPSALVRGLWKRKTGFSQGIINNILFTTAGTLILMLPGDKHSDSWNLGVGALSGILLGVGTANMYQYLQKRMIASVADTSAAGVMPLARKFGGVSALRTTAISFYSGSYIGSFIPYAYSFLSEKEVKKGATDFEANQSVLPLALGVYGAGIIPLLFTPKGSIIFNKLKSYSPLISLPLGFLAARGLYKRYSSGNSLIQPVNFDKNSLNIFTQKTALEMLLPKQELKIKLPAYTPQTNEGKESLPSMPLDSEETLQDGQEDLQN